MDLKPPDWISSAIFHDLFPKRDFFTRIFKRNLSTIEIQGNISFSSTNSLLQQNHNFNHKSILSIHTNDQNGVMDDSVEQLFRNYLTHIFVVLAGIRGHSSSIKTLSSLSSNPTNVTSSTMSLSSSIVTHSSASSVNNNSFTEFYGPHNLTIEDINSRIDNHFPPNISKVKNDLPKFANFAKKKKKKNLTISVETVKQTLEKCKMTNVDHGVCIYLANILEFVADQLIIFVIQFVGKMNNTPSISTRMVTESTAQTVVDLFHLNSLPLPTSLDNFVDEHFSGDYNKIAKLFFEYLEECFLAHMDILLRAFRKPLRQARGNVKNPDVLLIFGNLNSLYQNMRILCTELSDVFEDAGSNEVLVGSCLYDAAIDHALSAFTAYADIVLSGSALQTIEKLLSDDLMKKEIVKCSKHIRESLKKKNKRSEIEMLNTCDSSVEANPTNVSNFLLLSWNYLLPCLLQLPIYHFLHMTEAIQKMYQQCKNNAERLILNDTLSVLNVSYQSILHKVLESPNSCYNTWSPITGVTYAQINCPNSSSSSSSSQFNISDNDCSSSSLNNESVYGSKDTLCSSSLTLSSVVSTNHHAHAVQNYEDSLHVVVAAGSEGKYISHNSIFYHTQLSATIYQNLAKSYLASLCQKLRNTDQKDTFADKYRFNSPQTHFIKEGVLKMRAERGRGYPERYAYLFSHVMFICKRERRVALPIKSTTSTTLKTSVALFNFNVVDVMNNLNGTSADRDLHLFELYYYPDKESLQPSVLYLATSSLSEKRQWIISLVTLQTYRVFIRYITDNPPRDIPLRFPLVKDYKFGLPNQPQYVKFEEADSESSAEIPLIQYACLPKIIECITHHVHFDNHSLQAFLLCYRRFLTPKELLETFIERFEIPDPPIYKEDLEDLDDENNGSSSLGGGGGVGGLYDICSLSGSPPSNIIKTHERDIEVEVDEMNLGVDSKARHILKKFRSTYKKKVRLRVVNALCQWIRNPEYYKTDFDKELLKQLEEFIDFSIQSKESYLTNAVKKLKELLNGPIQSKPEIKVFETSIVLNVDLHYCYLTCMHPLEFARQVTLYEWELYRRIEYWELSGKEKTPDNALNMLRCIDFTNKFNYWLIYSIVNLPNGEERAIMLERLVDLYNCFQALNNMQGAQEVKGALISSPVCRLKHTKEILAKRQPKAYSQLEKLTSMSEEEDSYESYLSQLRSKQPPCVAYVASGDSSELIRLRLQQPDTFSRQEVLNSIDLSNCRDEDNSILPIYDELINFRKIRRHYDIVHNFKSFQVMPYRFQRNNQIWEFLDNLDVRKQLNSSNNHNLMMDLHNLSLVIEPKEVDDKIRIETNSERRFNDVEIQLADMFGQENMETRTQPEAAVNFAKSFNNSLSTARTRSGVVVGGGGGGGGGVEGRAGTILEIQRPTTPIDVTPPESVDLGGTPPNTLDNRLSHLPPPTPSRINAGLSPTPRNDSPRGMSPSPPTLIHRVQGPSHPYTHHPHNDLPRRTKQQSECLSTTSTLLISDLSETSNIADDVHIAESGILLPVSSPRHSHSHSEPLTMNNNSGTSQIFDPAPPSSSIPPKRPPRPQRVTVNPTTVAPARPRRQIPTDINVPQAPPLPPRNPTLTQAFLPRGSPDDFS